MSGHGLVCPACIGFLLVMASGLRHPIQLVLAGAVERPPCMLPGGWGCLRQAPRAQALQPTVERRAGVATLAEPVWSVMHTLPMPCGLMRATICAADRTSGADQLSRRSAYPACRPPLPSKAQKRR